MAPLRLSALLLLHAVSSVFGDYLQVIVGDSVTFLATGKCDASKEASLVYLAGQHTWPVAALEQGVWKPSDHYKDRVISPNFSVVFNRTVYTDTGVYECVCNGATTVIHLDVVLAFEASVTVGETVKLQCHYKSHNVESVRWERNGELVFELNLSSGEIKYGPRFKKRASVSSDGCKQGDFSLILQLAQLEDRGEYFCYVHSNGQKERGDPAAVRLTTNPEQKTLIRPPLTTTPSLTEEREMGAGTIGGITAAFLIAAVLFTGLGWFLKSYFSNASPEPCDGRYLAVTPLNGEPPHPAPANGCLPVNSSV